MIAWPYAAAAGGVALATALRGTLAPASSFWGRVISRAPVDSGSRIALTFDDGPYPPHTDALLDILKELNTPATFFVIGMYAERWPQLIRRMHEEGHVVANHTWSHSHFGFLRGPWYWRREISRTDAIIERIIGKRPAFFRPPMGWKQACITTVAKRTGHAMVTWSLRAMDGVPTTTPERIVDRLGPVASNGDILLLHDGIDPHAKRDPRSTIAAARPLIAAIRARGLEPVRLDDLLGMAAYDKNRGI